MFSRIRSIATIAATVAALAVGFAAAPALAYGSGSKQIQPGGGCNEGTYYYRSGAKQGQANAFTSFDGFCWGNKSAGARVIAGTNVSNWQYNWASVSVSVPNPRAATVNGNHSINGGYSQDT